MSKEQQERKKRRWLAYLLRAVLLLLFLFLIAVVALQFDSVQNWAGHKITSSLSKKTDSVVSLDKVNVSLSKGVVLEGFMIQSNSGDTLMSTTSLDISFNKSITSIWSNEVDLRSVSLVSPRIIVLTKRGESISNIAQFLSKLSGNNKDGNAEEEGEPTKLRLEEIDIRDAYLSIENENKSTIQTFEVHKAYVEIDTLLDDGLLVIGKIRLDQPVVRIRKYGEEYVSEIVSVEIESLVDTTQSQSDGLTIKLGSLVINDGIFSMDDDNVKKKSETDELDYDHFEFSDINLDMVDIQIEDNQDIALVLNNISFIDDKGFQLKELKSKKIEINSRRIALNEFRFVTERSNLGRDFSFSFDDFSAFSELGRKVGINATFVDSKLYIGDLLHFVSDLKKSNFFSQNKNRYIGLNGVFSGPIDRLSGRDVEITVDNDMVLKANFTTRNLTRKDRELINFGIKELRTNMSFLKAFIPGFSPPANFYKLGEINFRGRFDGYLKDFVAYGSFDTRMGQAFVDMRLDVKKGIELAQYSGDISLEDFDLRGWSDNDDLGSVNFSASIEDGHGLTLNSVNTELSAVIESISYKGYEYRDFVMDGQLNRNQFNGEFSITDENVDLIFDGNIEFVDDIPHLDFKANIEKIDLAQLNLSSKPFLIKGNVDINGKGNNINNLLGYALASDLYIATNDTIYALDTLSVSSTKGVKSNSLDLYSDVAKVKLEGEYDLNYIVGDFKKLLRNSYPHYTQNWDVDMKDNHVAQDVKFEFNISDTKNFLDLAGVKDLRIKEFVGVGSLDTRNNNLSIEGEVPFIGIKNNLISDTKLVITSNDSRGNILVTIDSIRWGGKVYNPILITSEMIGDTVNFFMGTEGLSESLEKLEIGGQLIPHEKGYAIQLADNTIDMLGKEWTFTKSNELVIGEKYLNIENLKLTDGDRTIEVDDVENKGVSVLLTDFDMNIINDIIKYKKMNFAGRGDVGLFVDDLYKEDKEFDADINIPKFMINGDSFGALSINAIQAYKKPMVFKFNLGENDKGLNIAATLDTERDNYLDAVVIANDFDLGIFEYILKDGIRNVEGDLDLNGTVRGPISDLKIDADAYLNDSELQVVYTGVTYRFDHQKIHCTEKIIDFTGAEIVDANGHTGLITGGIYHDMFTNFGLNANLSGDDVIAVNTTKEDNELYYGYAKGNVSVDFTGSFDQIDMKIACTTSEGTEINIPISDDQQSTDKNFIEFIDSKTFFKEKEVVATKNFKIQGMDIEIDLTLTDDAQINLIFDESKGDVIQGRGRGALKMYITRYGDFDIYGDYNIEEGDYLFTAWGLVAKPFEVRRGSVIRWTGDPVNAEIDIKADYTVRSPLNIFLSEYLEGSPNVDANSRTEVNLILSLGGTLYNPNVEFDLDFPNITGELASITDNKMRTLRVNQSDLNNQVLGLIVFNTFLPSNGSGSTAGADIGAAGVSTLSEFLSSQLSIAFTGLINDALAEDGLISGIDFDIGLNKNSFQGIEESSGDVLPDEIEVNLKNRFRFLDERLSLGLGGNYVRQSVLRTNSNYFVGDFVIEYYLSSDRKLKLKLYGKYDYDENLLGRRQKYGVGIGYRTEFGSLTELKEGLSDQIKEDLNGAESSQ